jgi:methylated-DNA-[protein]-cysteine S-methyltransferase
MKPCYVHQFPTPILDIFLAVNQKGELILLYFLGPRHPVERVIEELRTKGYEPEWNEEAAGPAVTEIREYFDGKRKEFSMPLAPEGSPFQQRVWKELLNIPHGETISYGELAARVGNPKASRAVGAANGQNPISLIIPCHRVIGSDKSLTGYGGGLNVKEALLKHEGAAFKQASDKKAQQAALTFA